MSKLYAVRSSRSTKTNKENTKQSFYPPDERTLLPMQNVGKCKNRRRFILHRNESREWVVQHAFSGTNISKQSTLSQNTSWIQAELRQITDFPLPRHSCRYNTHSLSVYRFKWKVEAIKSKRRAPFGWILLAKSRILLSSYYTHAYSSAFTNSERIHSTCTHTFKHTHTHKHTTLRVHAFFALNIERSQKRHTLAYNYSFPFFYTKSFFSKWNKHKNLIRTNSFRMYGVSGARIKTKSFLSFYSSSLVRISLVRDVHWMVAFVMLLIKPIQASNFGLTRTQTPKQTHTHTGILS